MCTKKVNDISKNTEYWKLPHKILSVFYFLFLFFCTTDSPPSSRDLSFGKTNPVSIKNLGVGMCIHINIFTFFFMCLTFHNFKKALKMIQFLKLQENQILVSINKVLLEFSHSHLFIYYQLMFFALPQQGWIVPPENVWPATFKIFAIWTFTEKSLLIPALEHISRSRISVLKIMCINK